MTDLTVIILTFNEEKHIARALQSVSSVAVKIFVIDSFSTDRTVEIARAMGAVVLQNRFVNYAKQFQWALDTAPIRSEWVMRLDADEIVESDLVVEIRRNIPSLPQEVVGINVKRKHIFMDRWIRHGGRYPLVLLRIWRFRHGRIEDRWMDEHIIVWGGRAILFEGGLSDHNLNDISFFTEKHNRYATREAVDVINQKLHLFKSDTLTKEGSSSQAAVKRLIKERIYNKVPFTVAAASYFVWRYIFQLGFLDGKEGLIYHFLQGYWYRFLVGVKVTEFERAIHGLSDKKDIAAELSRLTGLSLDASTNPSRANGNANVS